MSRKDATVEWSVVDDEQQWQTAQAPIDGTAPEVATANRQERRLAALVVMLFVLLAGVWAWHRQMTLATIANELQATAAQETSAIPTGGDSDPQHGSGEAASASAQTTQTISHPKSSVRGGQATIQPSVVQMGEYHVIGSRVMAQVTVHYPSAGPRGRPDALAYREMRFYRQSGEGWQRIDPQLDLMGSWQTLETKHFTIRYRAVDAKAVTEAALQLDLLYNKMSRDFGLTAIAATPNLTIEVVADGLPDGYDFNFVNRTFVVPSPTMLSVPVEMTDASVIYQFAVYPLAALLLMDVIDQHPYRWKMNVLYWQPVIDALHLWALWEDGGLLAAGHEDVVRWLYQNAQDAPVDSHKAVPEGYERLCRAYRVWRLEPWQTSIPLACNESDASQWSPWVNPGLALRLSEVAPGSQIQPVPPLTPNSETKEVTLATVIDYVVATYGRERLPHFVAALGEHASWQTLIPALFGVSDVEFEAGWQAYLAENYGQDTGQ
jgi:hypothetical protein